MKSWFFLTLWKCWFQDILKSRKPSFKDQTPSCSSKENPAKANMGFKSQLWFNSLTIPETRGVSELNTHHRGHWERIEGTGFLGWEHGSRYQDGTGWEATGSLKEDRYALGLPITPFKEARVKRANQSVLGGWSSWGKRQGYWFSVMFPDAFLLPQQSLNALGTTASSMAL